MTARKRMTHLSLVLTHLQACLQSFCILIPFHTLCPLRQHRGLVLVKWCEHPVLYSCNSINRNPFLLLLLLMENSFSWKASVACCGIYLIYVGDSLTIKEYIFWLKHEKPIALISGFITHIYRLKREHLVV